MSGDVDTRGTGRTASEPPKQRSRRFVPGPPIREEMAMKAAHDETATGFSTDGEQPVKGERWRDPTSGDPNAAPPSPPPSNPEVIIVREEPSDS